MLEMSPLLYQLILEMSNKYCFIFAKFQLFIEKTLSNHYGMIFPFCFTPHQVFRKPSANKVWNAEKVFPLSKSARGGFAMQGSENLLSCGVMRLPFWMIGEPDTTVVNRGQQIQLKSCKPKSIPSILYFAPDNWLYGTFSHLLSPIKNLILSRLFSVSVISGISGVRIICFFWLFLRI